MLGAGVIGGLALVGCGGPKPGTPEAEAQVAKRSAAPVRAEMTGTFALDEKTQSQLFPHTIGSQWTYETESSQTVANRPPESRKGEITLRIDAARTEGASTRFQIATVTGGKKVDEQSWMIDKTGIYQVAVSAKNKPFTPPQPVVRFPLKPGGTFTWKGTSPTATDKRLDGILEGSIIGIQPVDTDLGSTTALFVESALAATLPDKKKTLTVTDTFLRPGIGIVRYQQTIRGQTFQSVIQFRLKEYTIK
ncbi:MAG: hypothetical protein C4320_04770 [Armatimonadota bacterium]